VIGRAETLIKRRRQQTALCNQILVGNSSTFPPFQCPIILMKYDPGAVVGQDALGSKSEIGAAAREQLASTACFQMTADPGENTPLPGVLSLRRRRVCPIPRVQAGIELDVLKDPAQARR
jgi:hypothetical protein